MKRIIIIGGMILILMTSCTVFRPSFINGQYSSVTYQNGYWSGWQDTRASIWGNTSNTKIQFYSQGSIRYFILYGENDHPSNYHIKVSYNVNSERQEDKWYVYNGTVEYYPHYDYKTFSFDMWNSSHYFYSFSRQYGDKKVSSATVKIYKRRAVDAYKGATFNVFFEGNAIGINGVSNSL